MSITFNGPAQRIEIGATGTYDAQVDLYSAWKDWLVTGDNARFLPAFDTSGGDDIGGGQSIAPYFFLRTDLGWRIAAPEADGDVIIQGNLFPRVSTDSLFVPPVGDFTVLITQQLSARAVVVETGVSGLTSGESAKLTTLEARLNELWRMRGLDSSNPVTVTTGAETAGDIALTISGDGTTISTLTRQ